MVDTQKNRERNEITERCCNQTREVIGCFSKADHYRLKKDTKNKTFFTIFSTDKQRNQSGGQPVP